jgi:hypothetical protein
MTDSPSTEPNIEDRAANIRMTIDSIIQSGLDAMFERFDKLKKRGINDDDVVEALRYLGDVELLDDYAEWGDIDLREGGNTVLDETVPDPSGAPSYDALKMRLAGPGTVITTIEQLALLQDGVVLVLNAGKAAQIVRDDVAHYLSLIGWDGWLNITREDDDGNWEIVGAEERRGIAPYLPATIMGSVK